MDVHFFFELDALFWVIIFFRWWDNANLIWSQKSNLILWNEASIKCFKISYNVWKVKIALFLFNSENFVSCFVNLNHEKGWIKWVHNYVVDKVTVVWIFWYVLIQLFFLILFYGIIHESFHSLCEDDKILIDHSMRHSFFIDLENFKTSIMASCN